MIRRTQFGLLETSPVLAVIDPSIVEGLLNMTTGPRTDDELASRRAIYDALPPKMDEAFIMGIGKQAISVAALRVQRGVGTVKYPEIHAVRTIAELCLHHEGSESTTAGSVMRHLRNSAQPKFMAGIARLQLSLEYARI